MTRIRIERLFGVAFVAVAAMAVELAGAPAEYHSIRGEVERSSP